VNGQKYLWQRELAMIKSALAVINGPQFVAEGFNATCDHQSFRELLAAGFVDCADTARKRPWPGFSWPADRAFLLSCG
jgi:hypothetical protein